MSIVDDIKELFQTHAHDLTQRMHGIENHLDHIAKANDIAAETLDYDLLNQVYVIPPNTPFGFTNLAKAAKFLTVPKGSWYELVHWLALATGAESSILLADGKMFDCLDHGSSPVGGGGKSTSNKVLVAGQTLEGLNTVAEQETLITIQFKVYTEQPAFLTAGNAVGEES